MSQKDQKVFNKVNALFDSVPPKEQAVKRVVADCKSAPPKLQSERPRRVFNFFVTRTNWENIVRIQQLQSLVDGETPSAASIVNKALHQSLQDTVTKLTRQKTLLDKELLDKTNSY